MSHLPPKIGQANLPPSVKALCDTAKKLYMDKLAFFTKNHHPPAYITAAPGRVNFIGEHTDYTGGFVLPLGIDKYTVAYGTGHLIQGKGTAPTHIKFRCVSAHCPDDPVEERKLTVPVSAPDAENDPRTWVSYVTGTFAQYIKDLPPEGCVLELAMAFASDVPVGAGLSSSAALEVCSAVFIEQFLKDNAFSASDKELEKPVERALRCQKAENEWAFAPCGIMDQMASSCAQDGHFMLIDCTSYEITQTPMKKDDSDKPVILVTDSKVEHSIADGEYGLRRAQCNDALQAMQEVPLYHVLSLRDATKEDVETAKPKMDDVSYKRAKHVVTENTRTKECKTALKIGVWSRAGELLNASHASLRDDFEVSCEEVDFLVDVAQKFEGVYGSRMTGGGFGGCTITLVQQAKVDALIEKLKADYKEKYGKECACFVTVPSAGARVLAIDMDCKVAA